MTLSTGVLMYFLVQIIHHFFGRCIRKYIRKATKLTGIDAVGRQADDLRKRSGLTFQASPGQEGKQKKNANTVYSNQQVAYTRKGPVSHTLHDLDNPYCYVLYGVIYIGLVSLAAAPPSRGQPITHYESRSK